MSRVPVDVYDPIQQLAIVHDDVLDRLGVDTIELGRAFCHEDKWWADWTLPDGSPCRMPAWALPERMGTSWVFRGPSGRIMARMPEGSLVFDQTYWPFLEGDEDLFANRSILSRGTCGPDSQRRRDHPSPGRKNSPRGARALRASTSRAIIGVFGANLLEMGQFFYRMDNFLMMLADEPERVHRFLDALMEIHMRNLEDLPRRGR